MVADIGCQSLKLIWAVKLLRGAPKNFPVSKLNVNQNLLLKFTVINIANKKGLSPCRSREITQNNLLLVTNPFSRTVEIINVTKECHVEHCG